ncbi:MAG: glycosyltransferase [Desulfohalobiaceae bacterium]|nr:glycosyltransferase [Desulfohalobiaceae bacterium]
MNGHGIKADLHLHSGYSTQPTQWFLQKLGSPESFTDPMAAYSLAKKRGMDLVTLADHDTLAGALEIAHLKDVFLSEEVTAIFPEDRGKVHILVLDINEAQHEEIRRIRENIYHLADYLHQQDITHSVAHPLGDTNHCLTLEHVEKMLLLFNHFELNGARHPYQNEILHQLFNSLTPEEIHRLADKHDLPPRGERPWSKMLTAGSDDHSGLDIARSYTWAPGAENKEQFFRELRAGRVEPQGVPASPRSLGHNLYGITYQFFKSKFRLQKYVHKDALLQFADAALSIPEKDDRSVLRRVQDVFARKISFLFSRSRRRSLSALLQRESHAVLGSDPSLQEAILSPGRDPWEVEEKWFSFTAEVSDRIIRSFFDSFLENMSGAKLFNIFDSLGSTGSIYTLLGPYFLSYHLFTKDREFSRACRDHFLRSKGVSREDDSPSMALFTDTFLDENGVALTLQSQLRLARKLNKDMTVLTCSGGESIDGAVSFPSVGSFEISERPGVAIHYPSFLRMLDYCYQQGFSQIHAATPGPMGLAALGVARILELPVCGTYHAAFPQRVSELTGDTGLEEMAWKAMVWFYNQMDTVYVPSQNAADKLSHKGVSEEKIQLYPSSVDTERFHPAKRNGFWKNRFRTEGDSFKILYVGRISRERNLELLTEAFLQVTRERSDVRLVVVGDGPYLERMRRDLSSTKALFPGALHGDKLSQAYASSDLFLYPSSADTMGHVVLEAQASGLPALVGDLGGARENLIPEETGRILPGDDPSAFAQNILDLLNNPDRLSAMASQARLSMEKLSAETAFLRTWDIYMRQDPASPAQSGSWTWPGKDK